MKKRFFLVALLLTLTFLACCSVALADDGIEVPPTELISENETFSLVEWHEKVMPIDDELKLTRVSAGISRYDSTHVSIRAIAQTNKTCIYVGGQATVQQWKNNKWNNYSTNSYTAASTYEASLNKLISVETGYYYRLVNSCFAQRGLEDVEKTVATKSVLVN